MASSVHGIYRCTADADWGGVLLFTRTMGWGGTRKAVASERLRQCQSHPGRSRRSDETSEASRGGAEEAEKDGTIYCDLIRYDNASKPGQCPERNLSDSA
jgi:hypothetical protein